MVYKFILTRELGTLAKWLRMLGYDTFYDRAGKPSTVMILALKQGRIVVTRNRRIGTAMRAPVVRLQALTADEQLRELLISLRLKPNKDIIATRCTVCNLALTPVAKQMVRQQVPADVFAAHERFFSCPKCARVYWQGAHWENIQKLLKDITVA